MTNQTMMMRIKKTTAAACIALFCYSAISPVQVAASEQQEVVSNLQQKGWIDSVGNLSGFITRSESATLLGKALSIQPKNEALPFKDVKVSDPSYGYLSELIKRNIFMKAETFNPEQGLTRGQAAKIIVESFTLTGRTSKEFKDVPSTAWEAPYVGVLIANGITTGKTPDTFGPKDKLTRKHFYTFVDRVTKKIESEKEIIENIKINNASQMNDALNKVYTELPTSAKIITSVSVSELKDWMYEWERKTHPQDILNKSTLANYSIQKKGLEISLVDTSNDEYSAKDIEQRVKRFAASWVTQLENDSDVTKLNKIYDFLYDNYSYSAKGYKEMLVGNMWHSTMACNGFSRLAYELFNAAGMEAHIILGESHLWNAVKVDGKTVLFDVTSDIYLSKKYHTLGASSSEHQKLLTEVAVWSGEFDQSRYYHLTKSDIAKKMK